MPDPPPGRYELKFVVGAATQAAVLEAAGDAVRPDPHAEGGGAYRVTSQYFDTPRLAFFWEKLDGESRRKKVRLRVYGEPEEAPGLGARAAFIEIKHRLDQRIHKERAPLTPEGAAALLADAELLATLSERVPEAAAGAATVSRVERLTTRLELAATNVISYRREAHVGVVDERLRLTFDHEVEVHPPEDWDRPGRAPGIRLLPEGACVMELKFDQLIPRWMRDALNHLGLRPQRYSKYAEGLLALRGEPTHDGV